jgi:uncharacterized protein YhdP
MIKRGFSWALRGAVAVIILFGMVVIAVFVGLKYWFLPHIADYRESLAAAISRTAGVPVEITTLSGDWRGLRPALTAGGITIFDADHKPALALENVSGSLSWWTLFSGRPSFHRLQIERPVVALSRDTQGNLFLAGIRLPKDDSSQGSGFSDWLLKQDGIVIREATVSWRDAQVGDNALILTRVNASIEKLAGSHRFDIHARPPKEVASAIGLQGELRGGLFARVSELKGELSARARQADLAALRRFVKLPTELKSARGDIAVRLKGEGQGIAEAEVELNAKDVALQLKPDSPDLNLQAVSGKVSYRDLRPGFEVTGDGLALTPHGGRQALPASDFRFSQQPAENRRPAQGRFSAQRLDLAGLQSLLAGVNFEGALSERINAAGASGELSGVDYSWTGEPIAPSAFSAKATFANLAWRPVEKLPGASGFSGSLEATQAGGRLTLAAKDGAFNAPNIFWNALPISSLNATMTWQAREQRIDVNVERMELVNAHGDGWVAGTYHTIAGKPGFADMKGKFSNVDGRAIAQYLPRVTGEKLFRWLDRAIVSGTGPEVTFTLKGDLYEFPFADERHGMLLVTAKAKDGVLHYADGWPEIHNINGDMVFRGPRMEIIAQSGRVFGTQLSQVRAVIPDLAHHDEILEITGSGKGGFKDGLRFIAESPVREMTNNATAGFTGTGDAKLALKLVLPIRRLNQTHVEGAVDFAGNGMTDSAGAVPTLSHINGRLGFSEKGLAAEGLKVNVLGGPATLRIVSPGDKTMRIEASGKASVDALKAEAKQPALNYVTGSADWKGTIKVADGKTQLDATATATVFGEPAPFKLVRGADKIMHVEGSGKTTAEVLARELKNPSAKYLSGPVAWEGKFKIDEGKSESRILAKSTIFGGPATLEMTSAGAERSTLSASGEAKMNSLARQIDSPWFRYLSGSARWSGEMTESGKQSTVRIKSDLVGVQSDLPAPLNKSAAASLPLEIEESGAAGAPRTLKVSFAQIGAAQFKVSETATGGRRLESGEVGVGGALKAGQGGGIWFNGSLRELDVDQWRIVLGGKSAPAKPGESVGPNLAGFDLQVGKMKLFGRTFTDFKIKGSQRQGQWSLDLGGAEVNGTATWKPAGAGAVTARLGTLAIPAAPPSAKPVTGGPDPGDDAPEVTDAEPGRYPAMDIIADQFQIGSRKLGRLELLASQQGQDWRMEKIHISSPHAALTADGTWQGWLKRPQTSLSVDLRAADLGAFLSDVGYPNTVKGGKAELSGALAWTGEAFALHPPSMSGDFALKATSGQFLKAEPGVAKLLGLLNLQSLPRRITLDFRDVFSSGFAFSEISGNVKMAQGVLSTDNLVMGGSSAVVSMTGQADVASETQKLRVKVTPGLSETVAVAGAIAGGPVTGAAAYLVQKLLRNPIDKLFAFEYDITGKWDDPIVTKVARQQAPKNTRRPR